MICGAAIPKRNIRHVTVADRGHCDNGPPEAVGNGLEVGVRRTGLRKINCTWKENHAWKNKQKNILEKHLWPRETVERTDWLLFLWYWLVIKCKNQFFDQKRHLANPLLESFGESPKACVTNSSHPPAKHKGKENLDMPLVCSNYWPPNVARSLCFNHLVLSTFQQCRSAITQRSAKPIASIHHTVQYP